MTDKIIIANRKALEDKYKASGVDEIQKALKKLIDADKVRGLQTKIIFVDDGAAMKTVGGKPPLNAKDQRGHKAAVDKIHAALSPDYIVLLDGPDVIPHIELDNPTDDEDRVVPSDLPCASNAAFSRTASAFLSVTRAIGRLPGPTGHKDPQFLIGLIEGAAAHTPRPAADYKQYFAMSAAVWEVSTKMSLQAMFGDDKAITTSPAGCHPQIDKTLGARAHFINCHGAPVDPRFYGQHGEDYPTAMESQLVAPCITTGTVAAAECCYGAQLYDDKQAEVEQPICMSYLEKGAIGFVGSTNIAYGPSDSNGAADLLTQFFFAEMLDGASLGRSFLRARQRFVRRETMADPVNLKTLAQFILLGDPALRPCPAEKEKDDAAIDEKSRRKRIMLDTASEGKAIAAAATVVGDKVRGSPKVTQALRKLALDRGFKNPSIQVLNVTGGSAFRAFAKAKNVTTQVAVATAKHDRSEPETRSERSPYTLPAYRILVAHTLDHGIVKIDEYESR